MKMKIRTSAFAAAVLFAVSAVQEAAIYCFAEENTEMSGSCGENVDWAFDADTGVLTISGTGAILDPSYSEIPWYAYRDAVTSVVVEDGITEIGEKMFAGYPLLHTFGTTCCSWSQSFFGMQESEGNHNSGKRGIHR